MKKRKFRTKKQKDLVVKQKESPQKKSQKQPMNWAAATKQSLENLDIDTNEMPPITMVDLLSLAIERQKKKKEDK